LHRGSGSKKEMDLTKVRKEILLESLLIESSGKKWDPSVDGSHVWF